KFFIFTSLIIFLLIFITNLFSSRKANDLAQETIRNALTETLTAYDNFQEDRYTKLKLANNLIAQYPYFQAYIAEADTDSILDLVQQEQPKTKSDFIIVTDPDGIILARTDKPAMKGRNIANISIMQEALNGDEVSGLWVEGKELYDAVALPVITGDSMTACLAVGYSINDAFAAEIKNLTHSETAFFLTAEKSDPVLIATTMSAQKNELGTAYKNQGNNNNETFQFNLGPEKYIGISRQLKDASGKSMASFVTFRSLDRELIGFRQFQKNILFVGFGIMVVAFAVSFLGARRITGPLRHLTHAINEVKEGNYDVDINVKSGDEVGSLAHTFQRLLGELKEKDQLVQFLSTQPTASATMASSSPTIATPHQQATLPAHSQPSSQITANTLAPGTVIANRYEVQSVLGTGGMGVVLKAHDRQLDEVVALKMLKGEVFTQDPAALERFKQELKLARRITHRHVVRTYDYSELDHYYMISMEYVKGITLKQLVRQRGMLPLKIGLQIGKQICAALDAAHEKGVVHRDIKPQNILLESSGDVKIMDFGIARLEEMKGMTSTGTVMGTPDYMSPEQAQGLELDHRTDVYSTGVVLFEVFCGRLPFQADSALAVLNKHIREQPPKPSSLHPHIPPELDRILLKALAKNPAQRYANISELYNDLDTLSQTIAARIEKTA
ncbi:MAG TPA: protein kinase, partial [Acidobacteriota bacterium]|nr:protein kinase [Acidobacteriota bacterium]